MDEQQQKNEQREQRDAKRLKEITDGIEKGIKELFESDRYKSYLSTMSRFHHYSVNNTLLIHMQKPDATLVAGFNRWRDQFERHVKKGAKSIQIIAPIPYKRTVEKVKFDPDTKEPMLDENGKIIKEEKEITVARFKVVPVFDVSQTEGKPLPELASTLTGDVKQYDVFVEALRRTSTVPIDFKEMHPDTDGYFSEKNQSISIREGMSEVQTVSAIIHEIAHSKLHNHIKNELLARTDEYDEIEVCGVSGIFSNGRVDRSKLPEGLYCYDIRGSDDDPGELKYLEESVFVNHAGSIITASPITIPDEGRINISDDIAFFGGSMTLRHFYEDAFPERAKKNRHTEEVEAESISYAVCAYYGIETGDNSFGYIASWSKDKELKELRESLETINKTSSALITDIDRNFAEICKERNIILKADEIEPNEAALSAERLYTVDNSKYLHVQRCDEGFDYTIYDMATKKELDGGQLDLNVELLSQAALEICKLHNIGTNGSICLADISILDDLQNTEVRAWEDDHVSDLVFTPVDITTPFENPSAPALQMDEPELPDPLIRTEDMQSFGYTDEEMLPLSKDRALELAERDVTVYLLYADNTEAMALDDREIIEHDGLFGITREDWDAIKAHIPHRDVEKRFMQNPEDGILIYQLKDTAPAALWFAGFDRLQDALDADNYKAVYTQPLYDGGSRNEVLEQAFEQFNIRRPADFCGHSLSVSDIVAIKRGHEISYHYCDCIGFKELDGFREENYLKAAEMSVEDDYGMIDGIINNGEKVPSKEPEQKMSLKERLQSFAAQSPEIAAVHPKKSNEWER